MPIWSDQSAGLGTSDGDQQYVKGILSASTRHGPSDLDTASKSSESRQSLMRSPSLHSGPKRVVKSLYTGAMHELCGLTHPCQVIHSTARYDR